MHYMRPKTDQIPPNPWLRSPSPPLPPPPPPRLAPSAQTPCDQIKPFLLLLLRASARPSTLSSSSSSSSSSRRARIALRCTTSRIPTRSIRASLQVMVRIRPGSSVETDKLPYNVYNLAMEAVDYYGGSVTIGDVASKSGLKLNETERALQALTTDTGEFLECYSNPFAGAEFYSEVELLQHLDARDPQILAIEERGTITSSYIDNTSFPTNQERSINHNTSLNASSLPNLSPEVNLSASKFEIPMIGEVGNILSTDIKTTTASTTYERSTEDSTFLNELIQSRLKGLPDGWVFKIRYLRQGCSSYKVHIDPKSGYEFRSLMDAHRYILTEDIHHCVVKPKKRNSSDSIITISPMTTNRRRLI